MYFIIILYLKNISFNCINFHFPSIELIFFNLIEFKFYLLSISSFMVNYEEIAVDATLS